MNCCFVFFLFFVFINLNEHCYQGRFVILNRDRFIAAIRSANLVFFTTEIAYTYLSEGVKSTKRCY